jgi:hypothetical protein
MRNLTKAIALAAMLAIPAVSFAGQAAPAAPAPAAAKKAPAAKAEKPAAAKKVATKSASGTVKSISDSSLVITKGSGAKATDETFTVNASTAKKGTIETGSKVSVRYTVDGANKVATAITAAAPKSAKPAKTTTKK